MALRVWSLLLLGLFAGGCDDAMAAPRESVSEPAPVDERPAIEAARRKLRQAREAQFELGPRPKNEDCTPPEPGTFLSRVDDTRYDKRHVLPLDITRHVTVPDLSGFEDVLSGVERPLSLEPTLKNVDRMATARYSVVHHIVLYFSPKWIHRLDKRRAEWVKGRIDEWLGVYENASGKRLCLRRLSVENDVTDAPIRVRLRSDTRERLTRELGKQLAAESDRVLSEIAPGLKRFD